MKRSLPLALLALATFSSLGFAQDSAPGDKNRLRVAIHTQLGLLSPVGLLGVYASFSKPRFSVMLGGGLALSDAAGWRASVGISRNYALTPNNSLSFELWAAIGSWEGISDKFDGGPRQGHWGVMPTSHLHLSHQARLSDHFVMRSFLGLMTNFGVDPDEGTCIGGSCSGPTIGVSTGMSIGVEL